MFTNYIPSLEAKSRSNTDAVSDMSLLYLWFIAHKSKPGCDAGGPYLNYNPWQADENARLNWVKSNENYFFMVKKEIKLPILSSSLNLCNGLSVVNQTTFDHLHAWGQGNFKLGIGPGERGVPHSIGPAQYMGGCPEFPENKTYIASMANASLYYVNVHYQGDLKKHIPYDVCRVLQFSGGAIFSNPDVQKKCSSILKPTLEQNHCVDHFFPRYSDNFCV